MRRLLGLTRAVAMSIETLRSGDVISPTFSLYKIGTEVPHYTVFCEDAAGDEGEKAIS